MGWISTPKSPVSSTATANCSNIRRLTSPASARANWAIRPVRQSDHSNVGGLAREQIKQHEERIGVYEEMRRRFGEESRVARRMITLRLG